MTVDPARLYLWSGMVWTGALRAYWVSLVVRLTIQLELPSLQLVLLGTAMETALLVSEVPTGVVADRFSRKWSIVAGFVLTGGAQVLAGLATGFGFLVVTQILWGIAFTFRSGADTAWITDELGDAAAAEPLILRLARLQLLVSVASIAAGAALARLTSLSTSVVVTGVVLVATGAVLALTMPERGFPPATGDGGSGGVDGGRGVLTTFRDGARLAGRSPSLRLLVAVLVLGGLASEAVDRLDIRRLDQIGLSSEVDEIVVVAVITVGEALVGAAVLAWSGERLVGRRVPTALAVLLGLAAVGIATLGLVAVLPVAAAGMIIQGGLRQAAVPLSVTWTNAHTPSAVRATVHSFVEQANSVGEIAGGVVFGALAAVTTVPTAMAASAALLAASAVLATGGTSRWRPVAAGA